MLYCIALLSDTHIDSQCAARVGKRVFQGLPITDIHGEQIEDLTLINNVDEVRFESRWNVHIPIPSRWDAWQKWVLGSLQTT